MALHRESEMFTYWQNNGGGTGFGLRPIINSLLSQVVVDHLDILGRNAFFTNPYAYYGAAGTASGFSGIGSTDIISTEIIDSIVLGMNDRDQPFAPLPNPFPMGNEPICITTQGVMFDLKREAVDDNGHPTFVDVQKYAAPGPLITGEVGMWRGVRFVVNNMARLFNVGEVAEQTEIKAALRPGDGALDPEDANLKVDEVRRVGQPGATHWVTVTDASVFAAGDIITIHRLKHDGANGRGVVDGVDYEDPMAQHARVYSVTTGGPERLILEEPYMMVEENGTGLETDLGGTVFGYVTKGQHVHTATFINPNYNGLICGVAQPPVFYTPLAVDDYLSMYRVNIGSRTEQSVCAKTENCWNSLKSHSHNVAGNSKREGSKIVRIGKSAAELLSAVA